MGDRHGPSQPLTLHFHVALAWIFMQVRWKKCHSNQRDYAEIMSAERLRMLSAINIVALRLNDDFVVRGSRQLSLFDWLFEARVMDKQIAVGNSETQSTGELARLRNRSEEKLSLARKFMISNGLISFSFLNRLFLAQTQQTSGWAPFLRTSVTTYLPWKSCREKF